MAKLEEHSTAWNRCYNIRKDGRGWTREDVCPIRLRGYSELVMGRIAPKQRKAIDSAFRRGYRLSDKPELKILCNLICAHNPVQPINLGYVGKSNFQVYVPYREHAEELQQELRAVAVMTETFPGDEVQISSVDARGYSEVYLRQWIRAGGKGDPDQPQLKASFKHVRPVLDTWMAADAKVRECIARWIAQDDATIRIPFDTHGED